MRLPIPSYAKEKARKALMLRKKLEEYKKFGLTRQEAKRQGIASGVARAEQIIRSKTLSMRNARRVCAFRRFSNQDDITEREQGAIDLWGGKKFINRACSFIKNSGVKS